MPRGKLETLQDCENFIKGCLFMATGGGGGLDWGRRVFRDALQEGLPIGWVDVSEIPDDALTVTPYSMGSIAPMSEETLNEIERLGLKDKFGDRAIEEAVKELGNYLGKPVGCIVAGELGAGNTPAPLVVGARLGIPVVDGDYAGRAIPEEMQGTPYLYGKHSWPFASVDKWGNVTIVKYTVSPHLLERIGKMLAVAAFGNTTLAATPLIGKEMKQVIIPGTLSMCLKIGTEMHRAKEQGRDQIDAALQVTGGWRLFEGVVTKKEWEDRGGYMYGTTTLEGSGEYAGQVLKVWFKNENHVTWLNDKPWVCSPDIVSLIDKATGEGFCNASIKAGDQAVVIGIKGLEAFRTRFGLDESSGPRYYGFDIEYIPIEVLMKEKR